MAASGDELHVFISYARQDASAFAEELVAGLEAAGFDAFLDRQDIAAGEDWEARLDGLIGMADTIVYVITPASVASKTCRWELEHAEAASKRIIPVVRIEVPDDETPDPLKRRNYVFFTERHAFGQALLELATALRTDLGWIREHTRLAEIAGRWQRRERPDELLLRGSELKAAKTWLAAHPLGSPEPTPLHREFIDVSNAAEQDRFSEERERLQQVADAQAEREKSLVRLRGVSIALITVVSVALVVVGFFWLALNRQARDLEQRDQALAARDLALEDKNTALAVKTDELERKDRDLALKTKELEEKTEALELKNTQLQTAQAQLREVKGKLQTQADRLAQMTTSSKKTSRAKRREQKQITQIQESLRKTDIELGWKINMFYCQDRFMGTNKFRAQRLADTLRRERKRQQQTNFATLLPLRSVELGMLNAARSAMLIPKVETFEIHGEPHERFAMRELERLLRRYGGPKFELRTKTRPSKFELSVYLCGQPR